MCSPTKDFKIKENGKETTFNLEENRKKDMLDVVSDVFTKACNKCKNIKMKKSIIIIEM